MSMIVMNTDRDGDGNNMFRSYAVMLMCCVRNKKDVKIDWCIQSILYYVVEYCAK